MTPESAALFADYNRWMNTRLYEAAAQLPADTIMADRGAFFGSIFGTLNHLCVADTIWLQRFAQHPAGFSGLHAVNEWPTPASLRAPQADNLPDLRHRREALDDIIDRWVPSLSADALATPLAYRNIAGSAFRRRLGALLQHFFNHQTHHRGQVTTLLFQCGIDVGVTDLLLRIPAPGTAD